MTNPTNNLRGAVLFMISMATFTLNLSLMRIASADLPDFQAIFIRSALAAFLLGIVAWRKNAMFYHPVGADRKLMTLRVIGEVGSTLAFLTAVFNIPMANATAILQTLPLTLSVGALVFLKEPLGWRRGTAIAVGFAGVMLIIRPGTEGFSVFSLLALFAVLMVTLRDLATRAMSGAMPGSYVALWASVAITIVSACLSTFEVWQSVSLLASACLLGAAFCILIAQTALIAALRMSEISFVSPFRFSSMFWAILFGYVLFAEVPDTLTLAGIALIFATGVFTMIRERQLARAGR